jgi:ubiquinone/menaquinone biosynthesis C-methylase UbiE
LPQGHRIFAALYDRIASVGERAGMAEMRAELLREASGRTLEIGAGTGLNLPHYTEAVTELVVTEPDPFMAGRLRKRLAADPPSPAAVRVVEAPAEELPFENERFDTVVSTLVLCSVQAPHRAVAEIVRVLDPAGRLLCVEHVRSPDSPQLVRWQDRLERPWGWVTGGCHPNRDTVAELEAAGLQTEGLVRDGLPKAPPIVRPLVRGLAGRRR